MHRESTASEPGARVINHSTGARGSVENYFAELTRSSHGEAWPQKRAPLEAGGERGGQRGGQRGGEGGEGCEAYTSGVATFFALHWSRACTPHSVQRLGRRNAASDMDFTLSIPPSHPWCGRASRSRETVMALLSTDNAYGSAFENSGIESLKDCATVRQRRHESQYSYLRGRGEDMGRF